MTSYTVDTSKRVAIISGCSEPNSLGAAFSRDLLARGWTVFATARKESTLSQLKEAGCHTLELDVCSDNSVSQAAQKLVTLTGGRVDLLINNVRATHFGSYFGLIFQAGATGAAPLISTDPSKLASMHDLHVLGPLRLAQAFYPYLKATASSHGPSQRSKIVNIGSVISNGMPWHTAYASTKVSSTPLRRVEYTDFAGRSADLE